MDGLFEIAPPGGLVAEWRALRDREAPDSLAAAARRLEVAEGDLVAALCGQGVVRLDPPFGDLVRALGRLGPVRAVTRNAHASIETAGVYPPPDAGSSGYRGQIGVRLFLEQWRLGFAVDAALAPGDGPMLAFYDVRGDAVHETRLDAGSDHGAFTRLVDLFASFDQTPGTTSIVASPQMAAPNGDLGRSLRQAAHSRPVATTALATVLEGARRDVVPVSLAVRSRGVVQRYSGCLDEVEQAAGAIHARAPGMRMQVAGRGVAETWVVRTPSLDGPVSSLEVLDATASVVCSLSATRRPGEPESRAWFVLLDELRTLV
jgi:putative hemin transport protein